MNKTNITFATCKLSRYTSNPRTEIGKQLLEVLGYLKKTVNLGLFYIAFPTILEGYSNASWITSASDNKSTSRWVFNIGRGAVSWASKEQTYISHSTTEFEFITLVVIGKEAE